MEEVPQEKEPKALEEGPSTTYSAPCSSPSHLPPHLISSSLPTHQGLIISIRDHFHLPFLGRTLRLFPSQCPNVCATFLPLAGCSQQARVYGCQCEAAMPHGSRRCAGPCASKQAVLSVPGAMRPQTGVRVNTLAQSVCLLLKKCSVIDPLCTTCSSLIPFGFSPHHITSFLSMPACPRIKCT